MKATTAENVKIEERREREATKAEICFGALMAIAAISGMWGITSILISLFLR